jgi:hypothetical protein
VFHTRVPRHNPRKKNHVLFCFITLPLSTIFIHYERKIKRKKWRPPQSIFVRLQIRVSASIHFFADLQQVRAFQKSKATASIRHRFLLQLRISCVPQFVIKVSPLGSRLIFTQVFKFVWIDFLVLCYECVLFCFHLSVNLQV